MKQSALSPKKTKSDTTKRYVKPSVSRVNLVAREAVLVFCKTGGFTEAGANPSSGCTILDGPCLTDGS